MHPTWSRKTVFAAIMVTVCLYDATAYAINAIVSQDIPILTNILATEIASKIELTSILSQSAALVAQAKEYTTLAKAVWGAIDEVRHMTWEQVRKLGFKGLQDAFPQARQIYTDIKQITDLDYRNTKAEITLRGILWEEVYGPAIDDMHAGHAGLDILSQAAEYRLRTLGKIESRRTQARQWEEDCDTTSNNGSFGACNLASQKASIQSALTLQDIAETQLHHMRIQRQIFENQEAQNAEHLYAIDRWMYDLGAYMGAEREQPGPCEPGSCLYSRYGDRTRSRVAEFRARHPELTHRQVLEATWR